MYPLDIQHSHGKCFVFRWFSQLEPPIYFGDFPYVSHNQMVKSWWSRGENRRDCDFLNTFPHEKFWGLFSPKKNTKKMHEKKWLDSNPQSSSMWWIKVTSLKSTQRNVCLLGRTPPNRWPWKKLEKGNVVTFSWWIVIILYIGEYHPRSI